MKVRRLNYLILKNFLFPFHIYMSIITGLPAGFGREIWLCPVIQATWEARAVG
jgi:hypothetical protein